MYGLRLFDSIDESGKSRGHEYECPYCGDSIEKKYSVYNKKLNELLCDACNKHINQEKLISEGFSNGFK